MIDEKLFEVWKVLEKDASAEGLVCDIKIEGTNIVHWKKFFSYIEENCSYEFFYKNQKVELPKSIQKDFFGEEWLTLLNINIGETVN